MVRVRKTGKDFDIKIITNTYLGTKSELKFVKKDEKMFQDICMKNGMNCSTFSNFNSDKLKSELKKSAPREKNRKTCIIYYSGHGTYQKYFGQ